MAKSGGITVAVSGAEISRRVAQELLPLYHHLGEIIMGLNRAGAVCSAGHTSLDQCDVGVCDAATPVGNDEYRVTYSADTDPAQEGTP